MGSKYWRLGMKFIRKLINTFLWTKKYRDNAVIGQFLHTLICLHQKEAIMRDPHFIFQITEVQLLLSFLLLNNKQVKNYFTHICLCWKYYSLFHSNKQQRVNGYNEQSNIYLPKRNAQFKDSRIYSWVQTIPADHVYVLY